MPDESAGEPDARLVTVARIRRPQGRRGEVAAELFTDFPERFAELKTVWLFGPDAARDASGHVAAGREAALEGFWFHKGAVILKFAGIDSIGEAEKLAGWEVRVPAEQRRRLEGSAVYTDDLAGCRVLERGQELGVVLSLDTSVGTPVLVVDTRPGELLIPFAEEICRRIDLAARVIEVELPEGLRELNRGHG